MGTLLLVALVVLVVVGSRALGHGWKRLPPVVQMARELEDEMRELNREFPKALRAALRGEP